MPTNARVAAIVVAYNGGDDLGACVDSLLAQTLDDIEILVVDNGSTDRSCDRVERTLGSRGRVLRLQCNRGYAAGANAGWKAAQSEFVAFLNQDLILEPDCLRQMRDAIVRHGGDTLVTPKLVMASDPELVNAVGNDVHASGVGWCRGLGTKSDEWAGMIEVTAVSGAAFMTTRDFLARLGGLEESYFMYVEDVDISLRARLAGGMCIAACDAIARHHWSIRLTPWKFSLLERNRRALWGRLLTGMPGQRLVLLQVELMGWIYALLRGPSYVRAKFEAARRPLRLPPLTNERFESIAYELPYDLLFPQSKAIQWAGRRIDEAIRVISRHPRPNDMTV